MKIKRRITAFLAAAVMAASVMSVSAGAYSLSFTSGAPSSANTMTFSETVTASSAQKITVNSTTFTTLVSGAYASIWCTTFSTNTANVNSTGKYYLNYTGSTAPKAGLSVTVKGELVEYSTSKTVKASGTLSA